MAEKEGAPSNSEMGIIFETLEEWNDYLERNIPDFGELEKIENPTPEPDSNSQFIKPPFRGPQP